jgi:hypothetical protein
MNFFGLAFGFVAIGLECFFFTAVLVGEGDFCVSSLIVRTPKGISCSEDPLFSKSRHIWFSVSKFIAPDALWQIILDLQ